MAGELLNLSCRLKWPSRVQVAVSAFVCERGSVGALASAARHSVGQGVSSWGLRIQWMPSIP